MEYFFRKQLPNDTAIPSAASFIKLRAGRDSGILLNLPTLFRLRGTNGESPSPFSWKCVSPSGVFVPVVALSRPFLSTPTASHAVPALNYFLPDFFVLFLALFFLAIFTSSNSIFCIFHFRRQLFSYTGWIF
jgi:hypothetical protein